MMSRLRVADYAGDRLRAGPWRAGTRQAYLAPLVGGPAPRVTTVRRCVDDLVARGYVEVLTAALTTDEQVPFLEAGFEIRERLHLLARDLDDVPPPNTGAARIRRGHRLDRPAVLRVDGVAFDDFWRLDREGLVDALTATPVSRMRVATRAGVVGYAICGRARQHGYLQRLAVQPDHRGRGLGTALVLDGLDWMRRRGATRALVNTQESNVRALRLYESLGFRRQVGGLAVLRRAVNGASQ